MVRDGPLPNAEEALILLGAPTLKSEPMSTNLALKLREGTKKAHTMAENTGFVSCFLKGVVDKASYRTLVADLYFVYDAMEQEIGKLRAAGHPVVGPVGFPELNRRESLEQDLAFYFGEGWRNSVKATPAAQEAGRQ